MTRMETSGPEELIDLTVCDREPIHVPGSIQPHGLLLVLDERLTVRHVSQNTREWLDLPADRVVGADLADVLGHDAFSRLRTGLLSAQIERNPLLLATIRLASEGPFSAIGHRHDGRLILELEPATQAVPSAHEFFPPLDTFLARLDGVHTVEELARLASAEVRRITGFDRVLVYRFDEDGHGTVIAEERNERLPSLAGHRFPASDIPRQARELYRLNRVRLIADARYSPVPIQPASDRPIDLSYSTLRSVSPVHLEYMRNMGTAASMSISIVREGELWGLVSCHHASPCFVPFGVRSICDFLAQIFSLQIRNKEYQNQFEHRLFLGELQSRLIAALTVHEEFDAGLAEVSSDLMSFAAASGVAILYKGRCTLLGETPPEPEVRRLADWLSSDVHQDVYATDSLARELPWAEAWKDQASGVLALSISRIYSNYLIWFRPEILRTVTWAGDPNKPTEESPEAGSPSRLNPRLSFASWREIVRLRSAPWRSTELDAASALRNAIVGVVLKKAEELAAISAELERTNEELESFSYSVSHDLRAPFRHILGFAELLKEDGESVLGPRGGRYLDTIVESAQQAGTRVDNLLSFSRMGRASLDPSVVNMNQLVREAVAEAAQDAVDRRVEWKIGELPPAWADSLLLRQAVVNLLSNALKYSRPREVAVIEIFAEPRPGETCYSIRDNGIGFDMKYVDKLFGVFQRLHRMDEFEGTGIGLANVRRVVTRHGGRVWASGALDAGATFSFTLPKPSTAGPGDHAQTDIAGRG